jgi:hypothetical protein
VALTKLKIKICVDYGWSLYDVDETDLGSLLAFIGVASSSSNSRIANTTIINGKTYKRTDALPAWW